MPPSDQDGTQPGLEPAGSNADGRDTSSGDIGDIPGAPAGSSADGGGASDGNAGNLPGAPDGGDYTLDTLPGGGVFQGAQGAGQPGGAMTAAQRAAILDEQLRRTYETYDEIRRREQADARGAASAGADGAGPRSGGGGQGGIQQPGGAPAGGLPNGAGDADIASGRSGGSPGDGDQQQTFPPPDDIPGGRDDDVVARQLREAAMTEPDPELREALWDEYRNYTGIASDQ